MTRSRRPFLPGTFFHITTRTQDKALWFDEPVRDQILVALAKSVPKSDARLHALVVMTNHVHLVLRQGTRPLADLLQPFLCRVASLVHRKRSISGHILGHRFFSTPLEDAEYLRRAITYVHHNPIKANLCARDANYRWSSHSIYRSGTGEQPVLALPLEPCTWLYATGRCRTDEELRQDDREHFQAWCKRKELEANGERVANPPLDAAALAHWATHYAPIISPTRVTAADAGNLLHIATRVIAERCPGTPLELMRSRAQTNGIVAARWEIIERALAAGHRGSEIARFLSVSEALVSAVRHGTSMSK